MLLESLLINRTAVVPLGVLLAAVGAGCNVGPCDPTADASGAASSWAACIKSEPASNAQEEMCCGGLGSCFQSGALPSSQVGQLATDTCPSKGQVCVPRDLAVPGYVPPRCEAPGGLEGRCLSDCLPVVSERATQLAEAGCAPTTRCAPCYAPLSGTATGAWTITGVRAHQDPADHTGAFAPISATVTVSQ